MLDIVQLITKEKGRELIKTIPLEKLELLINKSSNTFSFKNEKQNHYVTIMNNSMKICVSSHIALLSLFNDTCPCCKKVFTHYALVTGYNCVDENNKPIYSMIPCIPNKNLNDFVFFNKDHIIPQSCNGANNMINFQFMCKNCNGKKSALLTNDDIKYGFYRKGIFHNIKNNDIITINQMKIKVTSIEQVKGGLFYLMSNNLNTYFNSDGRSIDKKYQIKGIQYGEY